MPFTDRQLNEKMAELLVNDGLMTAEERHSLLVNPTEYNVDATLTPTQLDKFDVYWPKLGAWLHDHGGDIAEIKGYDVQGRTGGDPTTVQLRSLYNDAFYDVNHHIQQHDLDRVKAVTAQLRFIKNT